MGNFERRLSGLEGHFAKERDPLYHALEGLTISELASSNDLLKEIERIKKEGASENAMRRLAIRYSLLSQAAEEALHEFESAFIDEPEDMTLRRFFQMPETRSWFDPAAYLDALLDLPSREAQEELTGIGFRWKEAWEVIYKIDPGSSPFDETGRLRGRV